MLFRRKKVHKTQGHRFVEFKDVTSQEETAISSYGDGGFRIGEQRSKGSMLITPRGYYPWGVADKTDITCDSLSRIMEQRADIDILLIGSGDNMSFLPKDVRSALEDAGIAVDVMATGAAARTYNVLLVEGRKVAAALIAVD
jgi:uncharacterized protein